MIRVSGECTNMTGAPPGMYSKKAKKKEQEVFALAPVLLLCTCDLERIRTSNLQNRNLPFYPVELRSQFDAAKIMDYVLSFTLSSCECNNFITFMLQLSYSFSL